MKKVLLMITMVITTMLAVNAQRPATQLEKKFFMALSAGPAIPVGAFASTNMDNDAGAGLAKTGVNLNLQLGYTLNENYALIMQVLYSKHAMNDAVFHEVGASSDHWQYYGCLFGPAMTVKASKVVMFDFKTLGGISRVNSPAVTYSNILLVKEDWASAFTLQLGVDVRYFFVKDVFLFGNADYSFMRPKFTVASADGTTSEKAEQKIDVVTVNAGVGIRF